MTIVERCHSTEPFDENGSTRSIDVSIVDMSSDKWDTKGEEVFEGIVHGFEILHKKLTLVEGFRVTLSELEYDFTGTNSWADLNSALEEQGFDEPKHYHVVYDGSAFWPNIGSFHQTRTSDGTMWHDGDAMGISGLSLATTRPLTVNAYVRGLHQLMHNYINGEIAKKYAESDKHYDAVHELGTSTQDARTVMADRFLLPSILSDPMSKGRCDARSCRFFCAPDDETLAFSNCTFDAVKDSIRENEA